MPTADLNTSLINDCLSDAVVYGGNNGDPIPGAMQQAVCNFLGGVIATEHGVSACDPSGATLDRPTAVLTERLGSKVLFDAVRAVWAQGEPAQVRQAGQARRGAAPAPGYLVSSAAPL